MNIEKLIGKTLTEITQTSDEIIFTTSDGEKYRMYHGQDCCESVDIEDIDGDLQDLLLSPILEASERTQNDDNAEESGLWTFYVIRNVKASVTIRWYGSSNGYYSKSVSFEKI